MSLNGRPDARAKNLDLALVARLNRDGRILIAAGQYLDALDSRKREHVGSLDLNRIFVSLLVDEVEIGQFVDRRQIRRESCCGAGGVRDNDWFLLVSGTESVLAGNDHAIFAWPGWNLGAHEDERDTRKGINDAAIRNKMTQARPP